MRNKTLTALALFLLLAVPARVLAQGESREYGDIPQAVVDSLAKEPPISQADVDAYIKIIPELPKLMSDPQSADGLAAAHQLSQVRFSYIMAKVPLTMAIAAGADPKALGLEELPTLLHPSAEELAVIKANLRALSEAAAEANRSLMHIAPGGAAAAD